MTNIKVVELPPVDPSVREALDRAIALVEADEVSAIAIVTVNRDGSTRSDRSSLPNVSTMVGGLVRLIHGICE